MKKNNIMTKNLKTLNKELGKKLTEFRKYSVDNGYKVKREGFFKKIFN